MKKMTKPKGTIKKVAEKLIRKKPKENELLEPEEIEPRQYTPEQIRQAEEEVTQRQYVEWKEKSNVIPETQAEMDNKLLSIEARMTLKKELMPAKDAAGIERNVAIGLEEEYPEIFTEDMVKGNYSDVESACIFGNGSLINFMKGIGQAKRFTFVEASRFNKSQMDLMINISRAKGGFSAILVKTDKHVSEGVVSHVQRALVEKKEKKWGVF